MTTNDAISGDDQAEDALVGRTLGGRYRIEAKIGQGGMGAVYVAEHVNLKKRVALKVVLQGIAKNRTAIARLKQEAIAASAIEHDNIVQVLDCEELDDGVFVAMELLRGEDLGGVLQRGPLPVARALDITYQIARALDAAHAAGIVHRDLKPENVFLTRKGDAELAKVLDFGISKIRSSDAEQVRMTKTGQVIGTPLYMSPEQARGDAEVDLRSDVYSLGCILYEMLTGITPFRGDNYFQLIWRQVNETPKPLRESSPDAQIPTALERVVLRMLSKEPAERFASMAELEAALSDAVPEVAPPHALLSRPRSVMPSRSAASTSQRVPKAATADAPAEAVEAANSAVIARAEMPAARKTPPQGTSIGFAPTMANGATTAASRHRGRLLLAATGAALVVGAAGVAWWTTASSGADTARSARPAVSTSPQRAAAPSPSRPPPSSEGHGAPTHASATTPGSEAVANVAFVSEPRGATVSVGGRIVCIAPCSAALRANGETEQTASFALEGWTTRAERFVLGRDGLVQARLERARRTNRLPQPSPGMKGWN